MIKRLDNVKLNITENESKLLKLQEKSSVGVPRILKYSKNRLTHAIKIIFSGCIP